MTGGGPGLMEAANRGAKDAGGYSVGCNIVLPVEQKPNPYLDRWVETDSFFVRKVVLAKYSYAFIAAPGGIGTLDELFDVAVLVQTGKMQGFPLVLLGVEYWKPLVEVLRNTLVPARTIDEADVDRFVLTDSPDDAAELIRSAALSKFGLTGGAAAAQAVVAAREVKEHDAARTGPVVTSQVRPQRAGFFRSASATAL